MAWPGPPWEKPPWWWENCSPGLRQRYLEGRERAERARRPRGWPLFIRFGAAPTGHGRRSLAEAKKKSPYSKMEKGVSCFRGRRAEDGSYVVATPNLALAGMFVMVVAEARDVYLAEGREVGLGSDAEPVLETSSLRLVRLPSGTRLRRSNEWAHHLSMAATFAKGLQTGRLGGVVRWWAFDGEVRVGEHPVATLAPAASLAGLAEAVLAASAMSDSPVHGAGHWCRVANAGARLCVATPGADPLVVLLFSVLHDSQRVYETYDAWHGWRAARFARSLLGGSGILSDGQLETLAYALEVHDEGLVSDDPTVGACWDGDRLNLWRIGTKPDPRLLSTEAAKRYETIEWARGLQYQAVSWYDACQSLGLREPQHLAIAVVLDGGPAGGMNVPPTKPATLEGAVRERLRRWGVPDDEHEESLRMSGLGFLLRGRP